MTRERAIHNNLVVTKVVLTLLILVMYGGCSKEWLQRLAYDAGTQRSCMNANENRYNESARDLDCLTPSTEKNREYDDYQRARQEELGN